jgi:hypothetical protein
MARSFPLRKLAGAVALTAAAAGLLAGGVAGAATTTSTPAAATTRPHHAGLRHWFGAHRAGVRKAVVDTSAQAIGIQPQALVAELRTGKSIAAVAAEHNVSTAKVTSALVALGTARINSALAAHKIDATQAAKFTAHLPALALKIVNHQFGQR